MAKHDQGGCIKRVKHSNTSSCARAKYNIIRATLREREFKNIGETFYFRQEKTCCGGLELAAANG